MNTEIQEIVSGLLTVASVLLGVLLIVVAAHVVGSDEDYMTTKEEQACIKRIEAKLDQVLKRVE